MIQISNTEDRGQTVYHTPDLHVVFQEIFATETAQLSTNPKLRD